VQQLINLPRQRPYQIVSFATIGSEYVECCHKQARLFKHGYTAYLLPSSGNWERNTKLKPNVIRAALTKHRYVLWVDADCEIDPPDDLPATQFDVGVIDNVHPQHEARTSAGFILFKRTAPTYSFIRNWMQRCNYSKRDHSAFMYALSLNQARIENITQWLKGKHAINNLLPESVCRPNRGVHYG
jgi:hypothetical protein